MTATEETEPLISTTSVTSVSKTQRVTYHTISFVSTISKILITYDNCRVLQCMSESDAELIQSCGPMTKIN